MSVQPWFPKQKDCFPEKILLFPSWKEHDTDLWVTVQEVFWLSGEGKHSWEWHCFVWTIGTSRRLISGGRELMWETAWYLEAQSSTHPNQNVKPLRKHNFEENHLSYAPNYWKEDIKCRGKTWFPLVLWSNKHVATIFLGYFLHFAWNEWWWQTFPSGLNVERHLQWDCFLEDVAVERA